MQRHEIDNKYKWAIDEMIENEPIEETLKWADRECEKLDEFNGKLKDKKSVLEVLKLHSKIMLKLSNLAIYCHMKLDEDTRITKSQSNVQLVSQTMTKFGEKSAFIQPQILQLGTKQIQAFIDDPDFKDYDTFLKHLLRQQNHILSQEEEKILAALDDTLTSSSDIYDMLTEADMELGEVEVDGEPQRLTNSSYSKFIINTSQQVRKNSFTQMHGTYGKFGNSIASMYTSRIKAAITEAKLRGYENSLSMALFEDDIPMAVYKNLIKTVRENVHLQKRYVELKKRSVGLEDFHIYDIYLPFVENFDKRVSFEDGFDMVVDGLRLMGDEYLKVLKTAKDEHWMDVFENDGKPSGAYSYGSYTSKPFVLLNYNEKYDDVSTMAHELGHSMHSYFTRKYQPFEKSEYSMFIAEVASTANEAILIRYLLDKVTDKAERRFLIGNFLDQFKGTLFRQAMFADFEMQAHKSFEDGKPLGLEDYNELYYNLYKEYFGDSLVLDDEIKYEWMRISHFYRPFYVFVYATSYCAALAISDKIINDNANSLEGYLNALKAGASVYPIDALKLAGLDMTSPEPIKAALKFFEELMDEYEALL